MNKIYFITLFFLPFFMYAQNRQIHTDTKKVMYWDYLPETRTSSFYYDQNDNKILHGKQTAVINFSSYVNYYGKVSIQKNYERLYKDGMRNGKGLLNIDMKIQTNDISFGYKDNYSNGLRSGEWIMSAHYSTSSKTEEYLWASITFDKDKIVGFSTSSNPEEVGYDFKFLSSGKPNGYILIDNTMATVNKGIVTDYYIRTNGKLSSIYEDKDVEKVLKLVAESDNPEELLENSRYYLEDRSDNTYFEKYVDEKNDYKDLFEDWNVKQRDFPTLKYQILKKGKITMTDLQNAKSSLFSQVSDYQNSGKYKEEPLSLTINKDILNFPYIMDGGVRYYISESDYVSLEEYRKTLQFSIDSLYQNWQEFQRNVANLKAVKQLIDALPHHMDRKDNESLIFDFILDFSKGSVVDTLYFFKKDNGACYLGYDKSWCGDDHRDATFTFRSPFSDSLIDHVKELTKIYSVIDTLFNKTKLLRGQYVQKYGSELKMNSKNNFISIENSLAVSDKIFYRNAPEVCSKLNEKILFYENFDRCVCQFDSLLREYKDECLKACEGVCEDVSMVFVNNVEKTEDNLKKLQQTKLNSFEDFEKYKNLVSECDARLKRLRESCLDFINQRKVLLQKEEQLLPKIAVYSHLEEKYISFSNSYDKSWVLSENKSNSLDKLIQFIDSCSVFVELNEQIAKNDVKIMEITPKLKGISEAYLQCKGTWDLLVTPPASYKDLKTFITLQQRIIEKASSPEAKEVNKNIKKAITVR